MEWVAGSITTPCITFLEHFEVGGNRRGKHEEQGEEGPGA